MRVSTLLSQQIGLRTMADQESRMLHTMQQLGSGRRVLTPADDPLAAAQSVNVAQTASMNLRFADNRAVAMQNLMSQEQTLQEVTSVLHGVLTRVVEAGNGSYSDAELRSLADTLTETRASLLGMANATDGNGQYLFSGKVGDQAPYSSAGAPNPAATGARNVQVTQTRLMPTGDVAEDIFARVSPGTQGYIASMGSPFVGNVTFGKVEAESGAGGAASYTVRFVEVTDPLTSETTMEVHVFDAAADPAVDPPLHEEPYESGMQLRFAGISVALSGEPVVGDTIALEHVSDQADFDLLTTLDTLIAALEAGTSNPELSAQLSNVLATTNRKVHMHLDNVLTVRASLGARMNELDALNNEGENRKLNYAAQLSRLEDVDYRQASSDIAVQTVALEAAQLAYMKVQNLSLFSRK